MNKKKAFQTPIISASVFIMQLDAQSIDNQRRASCGGLVRDSTSCYIRGFATNLDFCPIMVAEVWGAYYSLLLAWQEGFKQIFLEIDSTVVVALIKKRLVSKHPYGMVIAKVNDLLSHDWQVRISRIFREANKSVDCLASVGHSLNIDITFYMFAPLCLSPFLRGYFVRVTLLRLVAQFVSICLGYCPISLPKKKLK